MGYEEIRYENTFQNVSVNAAGTVLDIGSGDKQILVVNQGSDDVYIKEGGAANAGSGSLKIANGGSVTISVTKESLGLICAAGKTATVTVGKQVPSWHTVEP